MILRVCDVERIIVERETLWAKESCLIERAILCAARARADCVDERAVEFGDDDAVVIRVCDKEAIRFRVSEHLAGKRERQVARLRAFERKLQRLFVQLPALAKLCD